MLVIERLTKRFGETVAVDDVSLEVARGEFVTLLGPSGCGKTTTLRMVAGFESPSSGRVLLDGKDVTALPPQRRGVGLVFQNYALFPHLNVFENIAFGLKARRLGRRDIEVRVARALERVDLAGYERRKVQELSGGEQQRVALARALAPEPPVLLLDEPLSNLDAALRERTRAELRALLKHVGITAVFVTHDQEEAFALSDRIAVLSRGRLQQLGTAEALYDAPANEFVASFLGRANFLDAQAVGAAAAPADTGRSVLAAGAEAEMVECRLPGGAVWTARVAGWNGASAPRAGDRLRVMVRPESLELARVAAATGAGRAGDAREPADAGAIEGEVLERRFAGASTLYTVRSAGNPVLVLAGPAAAREGETVRVRLRDGAPVHAFPDRPA